MIDIPSIKRPSADLIARVKAVGAATASASLFQLGIRGAHMQGPTSWNRGKTICGPALTLQFMPKREDLYGEGEYADVEKQLHRHVLYQVQAGDVVVVDARGDMVSGVFGDMMTTYFRGRGGAGMVIDGCIRDWVNVQKLDVPMWIRGVTPNFHTQTNLMPFAVNTPIACGSVTVIPGDIILADDDGAICVPVALAEQMIEQASKHHEWEDFSRIKLMQGESLQRYYPLHPDAEPEYREWRKTHPKT